MLGHETITASEFKAKCLEILDRLAENKVSTVTVTKRGKPVAVLVPPPAEAAFKSRLIGAMEGTVTIPDGFDLTAPILDEPFDAELGILHR